MAGSIQRFGQCQQSIVLLLQHPRERRTPIGTARLAHLCLPGSELHVGVEFDEHPGVLAALAAAEAAGRPAHLLFPGPRSVDLAEAKVVRNIRVQEHPNDLVLSADQGVKLYLCSHFFLVINATVVLGLAFMFSCFNMKPAAATILSLSFLFLNLVMESIPFFERYHEWLLPYHFRIWIYIYSQPTPWPRIVESLCVLAGFCVTSLLIGAAAFQARDIKS